MLHTSSAALVRRYGALVVLAFLAACGGDSLFTAPGSSRDVLVPPPPPHYPIIFVHGYNASASTWLTMVARFKTDALYTDAELVNWSYDYRQSNATTAQQLAQKVDAVMLATGAHHVDIITHSMGALPARYYIRNLLPAGDRRVDAVVTLGGTNHGTVTAFGCTPISCTEMRPYSSFVTRLNATDETWGTPRYATWWSACDEVIYPQTSAKLSGAVNNQTACLHHSDLHENFTVYAQVRDMVRQTPYGL
jgi:triacylglycerol esterase/lipase EstA (alpha/beta hydrolase family)